LSLRKWALGALSFALAWRLGPGAPAQEPLPLFDAHLHYSRPAWEVFPPGRVLEILAAAGVRRALVSSTPDDGTLRLHKAAPDRFVPILRPYRDGSDAAGWARSEEVLAHVSERIERGVYKGIGEFHLWNEEDAASPQVRRLARLAVERGVVLHVHSGAGPVRALFAHTPEARILWAHAGMSEPPGTVRELLDRHANLWTEVSFREEHIAPGGKLDPAWRALLLRHQDRFLFGTDTYTTERWGRYKELVAGHRAWLGQLPREAAERIAFRNAVRLFGAGGVSGPPE
jgi:predicted TIM-barrel fold metal-dependent hydrolase